MSVQDVIRGMRALDDACPGYRLAECYARQDIPEYFANDRIQQLIHASGQGYKFRLAAKPITVLANRIQIASVTSESGDVVNKVIEDIRQANDMELIEPYVTRALLTYGDAYLMVYPTDPDMPTDVGPGSVGVDLTFQSPLTCRAIYEDGDARTVLYVIRRWQTDSEAGKQWHAELWYADRVEAWICDPGNSGLDPVMWHEYAEDDEGISVPVTPDNWPVFHEFGEPPIKHARTDLPYGRPEHIDAYGPQNAITKAIITQVTVGIEAYGWAERYRIMDDQAILDTARDAVRWTDSADADDAPERGKVETTALHRGPGYETKYFGTKEVGQFEPPDPGVLIEPVEQWVRLMAAVTDTPLYEFDQRTGEQMSGIARLRASEPLRAKERDRKRFLVGFWREVWTLALDVVGVDAGNIVVHWSPPEVINDPDWWGVAETRLRMGVPLRRILEEANYLPEEVEQWLDAVGEETTLDARIARLAALGDALQKIGTASALGSVDEATVKAMIDRIMNEAATETDGGA